MLPQMLSPPFKWNHGYNYSIKKIKWESLEVAVKAKSSHLTGLSCQTASAFHQASGTLCTVSPPVTADINDCLTGAEHWTLCRKTDNLKEKNRQQSEESRETGACLSWYFFKKCWESGKNMHRMKSSLTRSIHLWKCGLSHSSWRNLNMRWEKGKEIMETKWNMSKVDKNPSAIRFNTMGSVFNHFP